MLRARARAAPNLAERAAACEKLRRLPDETERDLHEAGLFRMVQPARVGGAELDVGIFVDVCAELARVCPSTAWNVGNLAQPSLDAGLLPARDAGRAVGRLARRADRHLARLPRRPRPQGRWRLRGVRAAGRSRPASTIPTGTCWPSWSATEAARRRSALRAGAPLAVRDHRHLACLGLCGTGSRMSRSRTCSCPSIARSRPGLSTASRIRARRSTPRRFSACRFWRSAPTCCRA